MRTSRNKSPAPAVEYVLVEALTPEREPWGMFGVFPKHLVDAAERRDGKPVLKWSDCIVGTGPGWEPDTVFDEAWLKEAARRMAGWEKPHG